MSKRLSLTTICIVAAGILGAVLLIVRPGVPRYRMELKTYFADAQGIRVGAPVRLAGVDVGSVSSVRARTDLKENAAEIVLRLRTPYSLNVPRDAVVFLTTAGVMGETYAEIDIRGTSGAPAQDGDTLKTRPTSSSNLEEIVERIVKAGQGSKTASSEEKQDPPRSERR